MVDTLFYIAYNYFLMKRPLIVKLAAYIAIYLLIAYTDYLIITTQPNPIFAFISSIMLGAGAIVGLATCSFEILGLFAVLSSIFLLVALSSLLTML